jgi:hypothetical protein
MKRSVLDGPFPGWSETPDATDLEISLKVWPSPGLPTEDLIRRAEFPDLYQ